MAKTRFSRYAFVALAVYCGPAALAAYSGAAALAQAPETGSTPLQSGVTLATVVEKVVVTSLPGGEPSTELTRLETAVPGDEVVYTVTFTNTGGGAADDVRITNPIPEELGYIAGTAFGPGSAVLFSVDGGRSYGAPAELFIAAADGTRRLATAGDYTHIRWVLGAPLDAGAKGFARFRAVVR